MIKGGFSFCGVDIADVGLEYAPDLDQTYVYRPAETSIREETFEAADGGYFYGSKRNPKEFVLRCFFEEKAIDRGLMSKIYNLFKVGKSGKLVFARKPWCYYYATVTNSPAPDIRNYLNGLFTVTMKAYYPYARCDSMVSRRVMPIDPVEATEADRSHFDVMQNTALFEDERMVPATIIASQSIGHKTDKLSILLANPGTERAPVCVKIAGIAPDGLLIKNENTGQTCGVNLLSSGNPTTSGAYLLIDGLNGNTVLSNNGTNTMAFKYHDRGFIELEPAYPCIRNVYAYVEVSPGNTTGTIKTINLIHDNVVGKYIWWDDGTEKGVWTKVTQQPDEQTLTVKTRVTAGQRTTCKTVIMDLNEISFISTGSIDLSHLEFIYKPTFS